MIDTPQKLRRAITRKSYESKVTISSAVRHWHLSHANPKYKPVTMGALVELIRELK